MRALVIQPDPLCGPGFIGQRLTERGYELDVQTIVAPGPVTTLGVDWPPPDPREHDLLVVLGARWSAYDDDTLGPWLPRLLNLLHAAHEAEIPVLGICFGGQALARSLGGSVWQAKGPEIGWVSVETDQPGLVGPGPWFQWHFDVFSPPPDAIEIARNSAGSQAFRSGRSQGIQFHPELTTDILAGWLANGGVQLVEAEGISVDRLRATTAEQMPAARMRANALVDEFLRSLLDSRPEPHVAATDNRPGPVQLPQYSGAIAPDQWHEPTADTDPA